MVERIKTILSELLLREIEDPRLQQVTITDVKLDNEISYANIYVNALGDENRRQEVMAGLERAKGFLRRELGKRIRVRSVPALIFHWDATLEYGERINRLIDSLDIPPETEDDRDEFEPDELD
ncbi:30S ribosome-binding factor RbfA [Phototrophicus methaneseepsis]|uniref:Ribosome-binding factor A n=2 Tax=Phototrophicus methaneseepsis TaxID=2710758 RepID=A0A7S8IE84_9CHLR|nr:30S ribosome-binding factor RbfA [Phototrophicus methaneseepsis]QPC81568.1 30S ribosome-binding factor RbfA [Phototrophicus methaneseepsis]